MSCFEFNALMPAMKKWNSYQFNYCVFLYCLTFGLAILISPAAEASRILQERINLQDVANIARALAENPYQEPNRNDIPESLKKIAYDQWRDIRYNPSKSLWINDPFKVQFFHRGFIFPEQVEINYIDRTGSHKMPFSTALFNYKNEKYSEQIKEDIGFAGLRIHYPLNTTAYADELISFLGASYFRALGKGLVYGISARGLAVNTAEDIGEEFPYFRKFWLIHPMPLSREITIFALLDSPSISGAFEFILRPGEETLMHVRSLLYCRKQIRKLGIAPLSSMFLLGKNSGPRSEGDFRLEVHDSDGLAIQNKAGEWTWHPLINPQRLLINSFGGGQPAGFGLLQRDTNFDHYQDLEARYDLRPSVWITPEEDWGKGHIELLQIPSGNEYNDNISTYWVPEKSFEPGESLKYAYSLSWHSARHKRPAIATVESTRIVRKQDTVIFMVDFFPDTKQNLIAKKEKEYTAEIQEFNGYKIAERQVIKNTVTGGLRLMIRIRFDKEGFLQEIIPNELPAVELRAFIKDKNTPVTETWSYTYLP